MIVADPMATSTLASGIVRLASEPTSSNGRDVRRLEVKWVVGRMGTFPS